MASRPVALPNRAPLATRPIGTSSGNATMPTTRTTTAAASTRCERFT